MEDAIEVVSEHRWPERLGGWNPPGWKEHLVAGMSKGKSDDPRKQ
jgi:hypothetical protein